MNVVGGGITVDDLDGLPGHHAHNVRMVLAATLVESDGFLGNVESAVAETFFHIHEDVGDVTVAGHHGLGHVRAFAGGILAHVNLGGLWRGAIELHGAADGCRRSRINGGGGGRGSGGSRGPLFGRFFLSAPCQKDESKNCRQDQACLPRILVHDFTSPLLRIESSHLSKSYSRAPCPALPEVFAPDDELPAVRARPIAAPTRRCSSGVNWRM